jgi:hypothetical protein
MPEKEFNDPKKTQWDAGDSRQFNEMRKKRSMKNMNWKFTRERNHKKELVRNTGFEHCNQWNKKYNQKPPKKTKNIISDIGYWSIELNQSKKKKKEKKRMKKAYKTHGRLLFR